MSMRISVVIPAYNAGRYIGRAIDSVLAQTRPPDEIIVVDDGSTDDTAAVVRGYGDKVRFIRQENAGASVARNTGIEAATGDWIAFLDADDEWLAEHLRLHAGLLERNGHLAWTAGNFYRCECRRRRRHEDISPERMANIRGILDGREYFDSFFRAHASFAAGCTDTIVVRRDALIEAGLFPVGALRINDMDMWFRIAYRRGPIGFVAEPTAIYHLDVPQSTTKIHSQAEIICDFTDRHLELSARHGLLDAFRPCAAKMVGWWIHCCIVERRGREVRALLKRYGHLYSRHYRTTMLIKSFFPRTGLWCDGLKRRLPGRPATPPADNTPGCSG